jgi:hypothetical protein
MGTRADFYVGRGETAEWLGSIAYDGYPDGIPDAVKQAKSEKCFREAVADFIASKESGTKPDDGWPWPWENSQTTDYAYAFEDKCVWASSFGDQWFKATGQKPEWQDQKVAVFPDMTARRKVAIPGSSRSGVMLFRSR